jgi:ABC-type Fe3+-hydroxamate transport system substrate-binding protein
MAELKLEELQALKAIPDLGGPPRRVVSLVPSMTESLFALGFGATVVGATDYCIHPAEQLEDMPRVGGPKNPDIDQVVALRPDLVFVNQEENTRQLVEALLEAGLQVWLTFPQTVDEAVDVLRPLGRPNPGPSCAISARSGRMNQAGKPGG